MISVLHEVVKRSPTTTTVEYEIDEENFFFSNFEINSFILCRQKIKTHDKETDTLRYQTVQWPP